MQRLLLAEQAKLRAAKPQIDYGAFSLGDFIAQVSAKIPGPYSELEKPEHLAPYVSLFERVHAGEPVMALASTPPQNGKTAVEIFAAARFLKKNPGYSVAFATYSATQAHERSRDARLIAQACGLQFATDRIANWRTTHLGGFKATSVGGPLTGDPGLRLILIDDPYSGRAIAESKVQRDTIFNWATGTVIARCHPFTSVIVTHTRWHPDDLIGRLSKQERPDGTKLWEKVNLSALCESEADGTGRKLGEPLWPSHYPLPYLVDRRAAVGEYDWWSMYQGSPRPRDTALFGDTHFYTKLPTSGLRYAIGYDLAYTEKTHSDYSVAVVMAECDGVVYVLEVLRKQCAAPEFSVAFAELAGHYPGAKMLGYVYGTEVGSVDFMRKSDPRLKKMRVRQMPGDKYVRALPYSAGWNAGKVQLPMRVEGRLPEGVRDDRWVDDFVSEHAAFTGINDPRDDQVDAGAAAFDSLARKPTPSGGGVFIPGIPFEDREVGI